MKRLRLKLAAKFLMTRPLSGKFANLPRLNRSNFPNDGNRLTPQVGLNPGDGVAGVGGMKEDFVNDAGDCFFELLFIHFSEDLTLVTFSLSITRAASDFGSKRSFSNFVKYFQRRHY
jgi:hypothetical protein